MNASHRFACLLAAVCSTAAVAGPLTPPGPPAPTMKTIQEAEPRTFISQADVPFTILKPGSYYLSENLSPAALGDLYVIRIVANNVTLDLRGFTISGATEVTSADDGVFVEVDRENVTIQNGTITRCQNRGIDAGDATIVTVSAMRISRCVGEGAFLGDGAAVLDSQFLMNGASGVTAIGSGGVIDNCVAEGNNGAGFQTADAMSVSNSAASHNSIGFFAGAGATLENCAAFENTGSGFGGGPAVFMHCTATRNAFDGFNTGSGSRIYNSIADENGANGFRLSSNAHLRDCSANANDVNGFTAGSQNSRLDSCSAVGNGTNGFSVNGTGNLLVRSSAGNNAGLNFNIGAGNLVGPIVTTANIAVSANPHANYEQ